MGSLSYQYDGLGNRIAQSLGTTSPTVTKYLLDIQPGLSVVLAETTSANVVRNVHAPRGIHAHKDAGGAWEWMVQDGLGSVRGVVDNSVDVLESRNYDPYGTGFGSTGSSQTSYGFTGEPMDDNGLLYLRARYYNPAAGVFTALDPFEGMWTQPVTINRYNYVGANPINWIDPTGLYAEQPLTCSNDLNRKCCGYDVTRWFLEELNRHANFVMANLATYRNGLNIPIISQTVDEIELMNEFGYYARAIPYKWMNFDVPRFPGLDSSCPSGTECTRGVTLCGKCIDRSELGNIMFGYTGGKLALNQFTLFAGATRAGALKAEAEKATAGIGIYLSAQTINSVGDLCNHIQSSEGAFEDGSRWDWDLANVGQTPDISQCEPCNEALPFTYPHTTPSLDRTVAGTSACADSSTCSGNPDQEFYISQIPSIEYLAPELCPDVDMPGAPLWLCGAKMPF